MTDALKLFASRFTPPNLAGTDPPPLRLRPVNVLPKQQRPLRSLLHYAASILSLCRRTPLRHEIIFGIIPRDEGRKAGVTETRRKFFALSDGSAVALAFWI